MLTPRRLFLLALTCAATVAVAGAAASANAATTWLCKPGLSPDPCTPGLSTTKYTPLLQPAGTEKVTADKSPKIDCFYVYPTVSNQTGPNANLNIDDTQKSIALYQAARYSQHCKVYAPMYRQLTVPAINVPGGIPASAATIAYGDVLSAFKEYLRKDNKGRGFILMGHSQGSFVLRQLIRDEVDTKPAIRKRLVSAILLGGNVLVKKGKGVGGDFKNITACRSTKQLGCVVAFSTFNQTPPADTKFGAVTTGFGGSTKKGLQVLCTNPAALGGGTGTLDTVFPSAPFAPGSLIALGISLLKVTLPTPATTWVHAPAAYTGKCVDNGTSNVLMISPQGGAPVFNFSPSADWGLHLVDANIALGNLVNLVQSEAKAYAKAQKK